MARRYIFANSMSSGEVAPEYVMRTDLQLRGEAAQTLRNCLLMAGGGFRRRPGTDFLASLTSDARLETIGTGEDDALILVFADQRFEARNLDGTLVQAITTSVPWTAADVATMQVAVEDDRVVVVSSAFAPRILTRAANGTWSIDVFAFAAGINGALLQPYYRFVPPGVSLSVSAYSGTGVSLTTSASFFEAGHVGARIRYTGVEIQITAVTNATTAVGNVIGSLYPTVNVTVGSTSGFLPGQVVSGNDTQIEGVAVSITSGAVLVVQLTGGYTPFDSAEDLVGPTAKSTISSVSTAASPAATVEWDEQLISAVRGYPTVCAFHRNRLLFGGFAQAQNVMAASSVEDITDFDVGTGLDGDAIVESVTRDTSLGLRHFGSTEQLLILSEAGPYYVPEQVAAPLSPTNYEILKIGPEAAADPAPVLVAEGLAFAERKSGRIMVAVPTGNVRRSWEIADLSELAFHLMGTPKEMELWPAGTDSDRQLLVLRSDGKIAVMSYRRGQNVTGWGLWDTDGEWRSLVVANGDLYCVARRTIAGVTRHWLEKFSLDAWGDAMFDLDDPEDTAAIYGEHEVSVWDSDSWLGDYEMTEPGVLIGMDPEYGALRVGLDFTLTARPVPPIDPERGVRDRLKITRVDVEVIDSTGFRVDGEDAAGWNADIGGSVKSSGVRRYRPMGRGRDKTITLEQLHGGPLKVRAITMEVTS